MNSIGGEIEECAETEMSETECKYKQKREERMGKWDGEFDGSVSKDFSGLSKKAKQDFLREQKREPRIKNLEDFGTALRDLKAQIQNKQFADFLEREDLTVDEFIEDYYKDLDNS